MELLVSLTHFSSFGIARLKRCQTAVRAIPPCPTFRQNESPGNSGKMRNRAIAAVTRILATAGKQ